MSIQPTATPETCASAEVQRFTELACFDKHDNERARHCAVVFRLFSVGKALGVRVDTELQADYMLYYDSDDDRLIGVLAQAVPAVRWGGYVFHRWLDHSRIQVLRPHDGRVVAQLEVRQFWGKPLKPEKLAAGDYGANVVPLAAPAEASNDD